MKDKAQGMTDLRAVAYVALLTPSPLDRYQSHPARRMERDGMVFVASDEPGPDGNVVIVTGPATSRRLLSLAAAYYDGAVYGVMLDVERAALLDDALRAGGWIVDEEEPALVLAPIPPSPLPPPELAIRRVATQRGLDDFFAITRTPRRYIPSLAAALDPDVALFVGYVDGAPVAAARVSCLGAVGEVMGVVTDDAFRRRGIGTAMTWAAIDAARQRGCIAITLTATEMGLPVYLRMGFVYACTLRTWAAPTRFPTC